MTPRISEPPKLSPSEWELIRDLLERHLRELPAEIHHTDSRGYREKLRERMTVVEELLARLKNAE